MYTLEDITKVFDTGDVKTEDGFNAVKTTLLTTLSDALGEFNTIVEDNKKLKEENDRLKNANTMLYSQIEKRFVDGSRSEVVDEVIEEGEDVDKILEDQVELYGGLK